MDHPAFWWEVAGKIGPPIVAGTLVAALLQEDFRVSHGLLLGLGLLLMVAAHWREQHRGG
jgi:hypothetical protein